MSLPATNDTRASEPSSFAVVAAINGTLGFELGRPIVQPVGTRFQIIRSTNSANAAVGTTIYDGQDLRVNLVQPSSSHWYWSRSYINPNSPTAYQPNTFGVLGLPLGLTTSQIDSAAIIDTRVSSRGTSPFEGPVVATSGTSTTMTNCLTYTNSLTTPVTIYVEDTILNANVSWNVAPPATRRSVWRYATSSSGVGSGTIVPSYPDGVNEAPQSVTAVFQATLLGGDTITLWLFHELQHNALALMNWDSVVSRMSALKR